MTITEFLLARIAEAEERASLVTMQRVDLSSGVPQIQHVAIRDRVLAECRAKRRIVELHPVYRGPRLLQVHSGAPTDYACETCHAASSIDTESVIEALGPCGTLLAVASIYADHPDFDEAWLV